MSWQRWSSSNYCYLLLVGCAIALCSLAVVFPASAAFNDLPGSLPREGGAVHFVVSSGSTSGQGSNLLYSPNVWLKVYSTDQQDKNLRFFNQDTCSGSITYEFFDTNELEGRSGTTQNGSPLGSVNLAGGCQAVDIQVPGRRLVASSLPGHKDLFVGIVKVKMIPNNSITSGPLTTFKVQATNGGRLGTIGLGDPENTGNLYPDGQQVSYLGRPSGSGTDNYALEFKPPCDFFGGQANKLITLKWFDDDSGRGYQTPFTIRIFENDENTGGRGNLLKTITERGGEGQPAKSSLNVSPGKKYTWVWEGITRSNGVQVWMPFDSANFDLACPPQGWRLSATSSVQANSVAVGQTTRFTHIVTNSGEQGTSFEATRRIQWRVKQNLGGNPPWQAFDAPTSTNIPGRRGRDVQGRDYRAIAGHAGNYYCQRVVYQPAASNSGPGGGGSNEDCVRIPLQNLSSWDIVSSSSVLGDGSSTGVPLDARPGDFYYFRHLLQNAGPDSIRYRDSQWTPPCEAIPRAGNDWVRLIKNTYPNRVDDVTDPANYILYFVQQTEPGIGCSNAPNRDFAGVYAFAAQIEIGKFANNADLGSRSCAITDFRSERLFRHIPPVVPPGGLLVNDAVENNWGTVGKLTAADGGKLYCNVGLYTPRSFNGTRVDLRREGTRILEVKVPYFFRDTPAINISRATVPQGGDVSASATIHNPTQSGNPSRFHTDSLPIGWRTERTIYRPDGSLASNPVRTGFRVGDIIPASVSPTTVQSGLTFNTAGLEVGSRVCFRIYTNPVAHDDPSEATAESCARVTKSPKLMSWGNDVIAGRQFLGATASCAPKNAGIYGVSPVNVAGRDHGTWVEYAALATGTISKFGSSSSPTGRNFSFANTPGLGNFPLVGCIPDFFNGSIKNGKMERTASGALNPSLLRDKNYITTSGNITINAATIPKGSDVVVRATGRVTIAGNITYEDGYGSLAEVPRLIIVADGDIIINQNVNRVDSWLITKAALHTCDVPSEPSVAACNSPLLINGAVAAAQIGFRRTFGADLTLIAAQSGAYPGLGAPQDGAYFINNGIPAELLVLNPAEYLKNFYENSLSATPRVLNQKELPPRY